MHRGGNRAVSGHNPTPLVPRVKGEHQKIINRPLWRTFLGFSTRIPVPADAGSGRARTRCRGNDGL